MKVPGTLEIENGQIEDVEFEDDQSPPYWMQGAQLPDPAVVPGSGMFPLDGERLLRSIRSSGADALIEGDDLGLHLTTKRIIMFGRDRLLLVIPSGRIVRSALIGEIDSAGVRTKRLSLWLLVIGSILLLGGIFTWISAENTQDNAFGSAEEADRTGPIVATVIGGGFVALWLLVKREVIVFSVAGVDHLEMILFRGANSSDDTAAAFIAEYYAIKTGDAVPPEPSVAVVT